ncbi:MAG TPA: NAD(P)/FAD-dependent oxidoreductase [Candidatus Methylomirabilis sp.]|nr:NAD(P)/FAD-dependent oxidoreductase [Candidatus Methylomirabilis sp.]
MTHGKALIIGAGIAGPVTAMALQRAGIEASIYEAYPTTAAGVGAFMGLAANGLDALNAIDLRAQVQEVGIPTPRMALLNGAGKVLAEIASGLSLPDGTTNLTIRRADLYQVLHDEALRRGVRVEYDKRLVGADETPTGVVAQFADGSEAEGGLLIGADGMRSIVRSLVDSRGPTPEFTGLVGTGGFTRGVQISARPDTFYFSFCKRGFFGYMAFGHDLVGWFANEPRLPEPTGAELAAISPEESKERLLRLFADDSIPARALIEASTDNVGWMPMHTMAAPAHWHRGRMVLTGDAAHVTSPSSGQGASLAMEDAVMLARCLRDTPDHGHAFTMYQRLRQARVQKVYHDAKRVNASKAAGPIGRVLRDLLMPLVAKRMANPEALRWLHGYHIEFDRTVSGDLSLVAS